MRYQHALRARLVARQQEIIDRYLAGDALRSIGDDVNASIASVERFLTDVGVTHLTAAQRSLHRSKLRPGAQTFDDLCDPVSCYLLGLLQADGWITFGSRSWRVGLEMAIKDAALVDQIAAMFGVTPKTRSRTRQGQEPYETRQMTIHNEYLAQRLLDLGIVPRKSSEDSSVRVLDAVPRENIGHFLRGLFDGDGSAFMDVRGNLTVELSGNRPLLERLREYLCAELGLNYVAVSKSAGSAKNFAKMRWKHALDTWRLQRLLYPEGAVLCLQRKQHAFLHANDALARAGQSPYRHVTVTRQGFKAIGDNRDGRPPLGTFPTELEAAAAYDAYLGAQDISAPRNVVPDARYMPSARERTPTAQLWAFRHGRRATGRPSTARWRSAAATRTVGR